MVKPLEERIAEHLKQRRDFRPVSGRVAFLALRDDIARAVQAGWPVKAIWQTLFDEGRIAIGYHAFNVYVNKYIRTPAVLSPPAPVAPSTPSRPQAPTGFRLNPSPKKEDIV